MNTEATQDTVTAADRAAKWTTSAATTLALLSASCCVLPIGFSILGLGGSWLFYLGPFVAYRPIVLVVVALGLIWAWWHIIQTIRCSRRHRTAVIWASLATVSFIIALSSPFWEANVQMFMWDMWRSTR